MRTSILMAALFFATSTPASAQIKTILKKVPVVDAAGTLVQILDELTRKPGDLKVEAKVRNLLPSSKLQVGKSQLDISLSDSDPTWRGTVWVALEVPTTARYTVDLKKLDLKALRWDGQRRILRIKLPPVEVESVTAKQSDITVRATYSKMRFAFNDSDVASKLERGLMRNDYEPVAKRKAEGNLEAMQILGRTALEDLLQKLFKAANTEVTIKVE